MTTDTQEQAIQFPIAVSMKQVPAADIVIQADLRPETLALISEAKNMLAERRHIAISSNDEYAMAADELAKIKAASKSIDEQRKTLTAPLDAEKKRLMDFVRPFIDALASAETLFKNGMIAFDQEQERLRKLAEAEAEEKRRKAEEALAKRADKAEAAGHTEKADALREQAASTVVAAPVTFDAPKVKGVSSRKTYSAEVTDLMELAKAVVAGTVPVKALMADTKFLNKMASTMQDDFAYPGCKLVVGTTMAVRSK